MKFSNKVKSQNKCVLISVCEAIFFKRKFNLKLCSFMNLTVYNNKIDFNQ